MMKDERYLINQVQSGNMEAMEELIKENNGLIWSIVRRFLGRGYEVEDLYQLGCIGFIKSIKRFDISFDYKMSTFAVPYILGEIKKFIRDDGMIKISRSIKELGLKIKDIEQNYIKDSGESISIKKLAELLDESEENIVEAIDAGKQIESINTEVFENGKEEKIERIIGIKCDEQNKIVDRLIINDMVERLGVREKTIIKLRYFKQKTQSQVAKLLGISQVQVSRIEKKILGEMKEKMVG